VHLVEEPGEALDFIDHDQTILGPQFLVKPSGLLAQGKKGDGIEKIVDSDPFQGVSDQEALARKAGPQEGM